MTPGWPVRAANLLLLLLFPLSWVAPIARAGVLPWFSGSEISIVGGIADLAAVDPLLAGLVALFAIALPYAKTCLLAAAHLGQAGARAVGWIEAVGRFSMADVFLVAVYIVLVRGVGIGHVSTAWGLWLFTGCVLVSLWAGWATGRAMRTGRDRR